jgi:diguanylate cyclase (GGDEF)-like protein
MGEAVIFNGRAAGRRRAERNAAAELDVLFERLIARVQSGKASRAALRAADVELIERTRTAVRVASRTVSDLEARVDALQRLAVTDELTGLLNRRGFSLEVERALARAHRYGDEGALIYIDIDAFKRINDGCGHAAGDEVLRHVARLLNASVRCTDHVGRLGGDEFAVLLSRASVGGSRKRAAHLAQRLQGTEVLFAGNVIPVNASVGIAIYGRGHCLDAAALLDGADRAMYAEKDWRRLQCEPRKFALAG